MTTSAPCSGSLPTRCARGPVRHCSEIGGADPDAQVGLSDYLLGQADPIGRADAVRHLQNDPEANALAQRLVQNLKLLAPKAELPEIPEPRGGRRAAAPLPRPRPPAHDSLRTPQAPAPPPPPRAEGPGLRLPCRGLLQRHRGIDAASAGPSSSSARAAALALVIVVVVVATSGGSSGGKRLQGRSTPPRPSRPAFRRSSSSPPARRLMRTARRAGRSRSAPRSRPPTANNQTPTFALQANAVHLPPTANGDRYLLWLYKSDTQSLPLGQETVD